MTEVIDLPKAQQAGKPLGRTVDQIHIADPKLKEVLKVCNLSFDTISSWFSSSIDDEASLSVEGDTVYIKVKNHFHRDWIGQKFREPLLKAVQECFSKNVKHLKMYTTLETREDKEPYPLKKKKE